MFQKGFSFSVPSRPPKLTPFCGSFTASAASLSHFRAKSSTLEENSKRRLGIGNHRTSLPFRPFAFFWLLWFWQMIKILGLSLICKTYIVKRTKLFGVFYMSFIFFDVSSAFFDTTFRKYLPHGVSLYSLRPFHLHTFKAFRPCFPEREN